MFAAEHTDFDLKAFLVLNKRFVVVALRFAHVADLGISCSHVWVVIAMPCNGTIQGRPIHAQRLAELHADLVKEDPRQIAHDPNIPEHSTVCTSATLPSVNTTAAPSRARPIHR
jgi:hypothetical protein